MMKLINRLTSYVSGAVMEAQAITNTINVFLMIMKPNTTENQMQVFFYFL